jgi:hypothetical protein
MYRVFHLSAGLGDAIYSLPTVKLMGGGTFVCGNTYEQYLTIKPLLEAQPYIDNCFHISEIDLPRDFVNLDLFRNNPLGNKVHLVDLFLTYFGFAKYDWSKGGWLENIEEIKPYKKDYTVINITSRYRDKVFKKLGGWKRRISRMSVFNKVIFLGDIISYQEAKSEIKKLPMHFKTKDLLEAAEIIKGASYFLGTQSSLLAIRQGLGLHYDFEQSPNHVDVNQYSDREYVMNPITRRLHLLLVSIKKAIKGK